MINFRRGSFRLWIVLTLIWIVSVLSTQSDDLLYAYRYHAHHESVAREHEEFRVRRLAELRDEESSLLEEERAQRSKESKESNSDYGRALQAAGLPPTKAPPNPRLEEVHNLAARYSQPAAPYTPRYEALALLLLPPVGLALMSIAAWVVGIWVFKGFRGQN